jgi:hypothetical protein
LAFAARHRPGVVLDCPAAGMLRAINRAVAIPRAIGKSAAKAYGNFKQQDNENAEKQIHGGLECEWRTLRAASCISLSA